MVSFKQFLNERLLEAVVRKWSLEHKSVEEAISLLNTHCKQGLLAIKNGGMLWRGFGSSKIDNKDFQFIDTSNSLRTSRDYENAYMLLMNASKHLQDYPSRSNSLICSTSWNVASGYSNGDAVAVIPFDGAKIAYADGSSDFNEISGVKQFKKIGLESTIVEIEMDHFFKMLTSSAISTKTKNGNTLKEFTDHKIIDAAMTKFSPEELTILWNIAIFYSSENLKINASKVNNQQAEDYEDLLRSLDEIPSDAIQNGKWRNNAQQKVFNAIRDAVLKRHITFTNELKNFYGIMRAAPTDQRFTYLASELVKPETLKLKLVDYGSLLPNNVECWVSGKAILISHRMFGRIICELYYRDPSSVHQRIYKIYESKIKKFLKDKEKEKSNETA